jgi:hypothetical protein
MAFIEVGVIEVGIPADRVRIVIVHNRNQVEDHMVFTILSGRSMVHR